MDPRRRVGQGLRHALGGGTLIPRIALIGLPASGKTSVGRELAAALGLPFLDSDELVEAEAGKPVAAIIEKEGEPGFRARESRALAAAAAGPPCVLATGGGIVLSADNRELLRGRFTVVWLRVSPEVAASRAASAPGSRPLLGRGDPAGRMRELDEARRGLYAGTARLIVDASSAAPRELARELAETLAPGEPGAAGDGSAPC